MTRRNYNAVYAAIMLAISIGRPVAAVDYEITMIVDETGAGGINTLDAPSNIAVDPAGNLFVAGYLSGNVLRITPDGHITEIIDASGNGQGATLTGAYGLAVNDSGHVFVGGTTSDNVFKITPGGEITEIISPAGDGQGGGLNQVGSIAAGSNGNVYVSGVISDNLLRASLGGVDEMMNHQDGLNTPSRVRVNEFGDAFVHGHGIIYRATADGFRSEFLDSFNDLTGFYFEGLVDFDFDSNGNLYLVGINSDNVLRVSPEGDIEEIINADGDGDGNELDQPYRIAFDHDNNAYVVGFISNNVFKVTTDGEITQIIDFDGDGQGNTLDRPSAIAIDSQDRVFVLASQSDKVFRLTPIEAPGQVDATEPDSEGTVNEPTEEATNPSGSPMTGTPTETTVTEDMPGVSTSSVCGSGMPMATPLLMLAFGGATGRIRRRNRAACKASENADSN